MPTVAAALVFRVTLPVGVPMEPEAAVLIVTVAEAPAAMVVGVMERVVAER